MSQNAHQDISKNIAQLHKEVEHLEKVHAPRQPTVMAYGAYNHGKSSLLNALIGDDVFSVSDKRETRQAQSHNANDICWLDTPGLFADIAGDDDRIAQGELDMADHLLLVHSLSSGELDQQEQASFQHQVGDTPERCTLVLTALDDVDDATHKKIAAKVAQQLPGVEQLAVSSHRYAKGVQHNKQGMIRHSHLPELQTRIAVALAGVEQRRATIKQQSINQINRKLRRLIKQLQSSKQKTEQQLAKQEADLLSDLISLQDEYQ